MDWEDGSIGLDLSSNPENPHRKQDMVTYIQNVTPAVSGAEPGGSLGLRFSTHPVRVSIGAIKCCEQVEEVA